jgi:diacylglycerol kinase (ATP)
MEPAEPGPWVAVVANPRSGAGPTARRVAALADALGRRGLPGRILWSPAERSAALLDPGRMATCRAVVAAGGDGTVADVVNELPAGVPLAALPAGNENLFARALGFDADPERLAAAVARGHTRRLDLGRARGRLFTLVAGVGFDAEVVRRLSAWRAAGPTLRRVTRLSYARPLAAALAAGPGPRLTIEADGREAHGLQCLVVNIPAYALGLQPAPAARPDDGLLDWVVFQRPGLLALGRYTWAMVRRRHLERRDVAHGRARTIRVRSEDPAPVQVDGDPAGCTPLEITVVPAALTVIVP